MTGPVSRKSRHSRFLERGKRKCYSRVQRYILSTKQEKRQDVMLQAAKCTKPTTTNGMGTHMGYAVAAYFTIGLTPRADRYSFAAVVLCPEVNFIEKRRAAGSTH